MMPSTTERTIARRIDRSAGAYDLSDIVRAIGTEVGP